jgi:hypothetical protein
VTQSRSNTTLWDANPRCHDVIEVAYISNWPVVSFQGWQFRLQLVCVIRSGIDAWALDTLAAQRALCSLVDDNIRWKYNSAVVECLKIKENVLFKRPKATLLLDVLQGTSADVLTADFEGGFT